MAKPLETHSLNQEQFAAPSCAIGPEPKAVERKAEQWPLNVMLGRQRTDMGVMVLHRNNRRAEPIGKSRGRKIGMQVACNRHPLDLEDRQHVPERFLKKRDRNGRVEIPDMLRDEGFVAARDRDRCLELGAERDNAGKLARQLDRRRREAAARI